MDPSPAQGVDLIQAHRAAKKRLRVLRIVFPLLVLVVVVLNVWAIVQQVRGIDEDALATEMEGQFHKLWPRIEDDLATVATALTPVLEKEVANQAAKMTPKLEARLESGVEKLKLDVEKDFETALARALQEVETRQRNVLVAQIPELAGDAAAQDRVLEAVRVALMKWCMRQLTDTLHEHMLVMEQIRKTLQKSFTMPASKEVDAEQAVALWLDLMYESVGGDDTILAPREDEPAAKKAKKKTSNGDGR